jgi:excisionase family DNA binding protein
MLASPQFLSCQEVAKQLNVNEDTVAKWCRTGARGPRGLVRLHGIRLGARLWRISQEALDQFLQELNPGREVHRAGEQAARRCAAEQAKKRIKRAMGLS